MSLVLVLFSYLQTNNQELKTLLLNMLEHGLLNNHSLVEHFRTESIQQKKSSIPSLLIEININLFAVLEVAVV